MKKSTLLLLLILVNIPTVYAQFKVMGFWQNRTPLIKFTTATQTVFNYNCSAIVTVQSTRATGATLNVATDTVVELNSAGLTFYSDANCNTPITSVTIASTRNNASLYFTANTAGIPQISVSATSFKSGIQGQTISTNPFIWTGGGGNANWSTGLNWSGGAAPVSYANQAIFNGDCTANCSPIISSSLTIGGVRILSGYSGTISQASGVTLMIGASGWYQEAGTFSGGDSAITNAGNFGLKGGTYSASTAINTFRGNFILTGSPTFNYSES